MSRPRAALCLGMALALGGVLGASASESVAAATVIGRYRVERSGADIEIARPRDRGLGLLLVAGGLVLAGLGQGLRASGRRGAGTAALVLGLALAAVGAVAVLATERWRANGLELVRERLGGRVERWPQSAIERVEIARRVVSAEDFKRTGIRPWDVTVRGRDGSRLPAQFSLASEAEARALAQALAGALAVEVRAERR